MVKMKLVLRKGGNLMKGKYKYYLKKTKLLWLPFFIWFIFSIGLVIGINYFTSTPDGAFSHAEPTHFETLKLRKLDYLMVSSNGLDVELGMSDSRRDIKLELIGADANPHSLYYQVDGTRLLVQAEKFLKRGTLRIILPQGDLVAGAIKAEAGNIDIRDFRADNLDLFSTGYDLRLEDVKVDRLQVEGNRTNLRLKNNLFGVAKLLSPYGNLDLRDSDIARLDVTVGGMAFLYDSRWKGQWEVRAERGIHALSRSLPFNLLLEARSIGLGDIYMDYQGKWQEARVSETNAKSYMAVRGKANNSLRLWTNEGNILIEKRDRETLIQPFDEN